MFSDYLVSVEATYRSGRQALVPRDERFVPDSVEQPNVIHQVALALREVTLGGVDRPQ